MSINEIPEKERGRIFKVRWVIWDIASFLLFGWQWFSQLVQSLLWHFIPKNCNGLITMSTWIWT